jgi:hypothetical protein
MTSKDQYLKFIESVRPKKSFLDDRIPDSPNYIETDYWAALPSKDGFHNLSPDQAPSSDLKDYDVFLFIPLDTSSSIGMLLLILSLLLMNEQVVIWPLKHQPLLQPAMYTHPIIGKQLTIHFLIKRVMVSQRRT